MADVKYKDATPVDEPVERAKQKAKPMPPKQEKKLRYTETTGFKPNDSEEIKPAPVEGLDLTETKMAKGGSASSRADGIAQRGKTRGTMIMCSGGMAKK
jgi:hypothetical protein